MRSLLDALQEGRLVELPTNDKSEVLEYLALLIEAIPGIQSDVDIVKEIQEREIEGNTGLGKGIASPHVRVKRQGELLCAVGWSPEGIDYGCTDGKKVHVVIMYYIPDTARVTYLKELSGLAKAVLKSNDEILFNQLPDIHSVRNTLLDWVELSVNDALPSATARMIRLDEKQAATEKVPVLPDNVKKAYTVIPFTLVRLDLDEFRILSQNKDFIEQLESTKGVVDFLNAPHDTFEINGYFITIISSLYYAANREIRECVAVKQ